MNEWQVCRQIAYRLRGRVWEGTGQPVFPADSVVVTAAPPRDMLGDFRKPMAIVRPRELSADPDHRQEPGLERGNVIVTLVVEHPGDRSGQAAMVGASRAGPDQSFGRGLLEVGEEAKAAIRLLSRDGGLRIRFVAAGAATPELLDKRYTLIRDYLFEATFTDRRTYEAATKFAGTVAGPSVNLTWTLPPDRFDRDKVVLVRKAGASPPASIADGTVLALAGDLVSSHADAPGVGTWSYGLWLRYDEYEDGASYRYSAPVAVAGLTVT